MVLLRWTTEVFDMDLYSHKVKQVFGVTVVFLAFIPIWPWSCHGQRLDTEKDIRGIFKGVDNFRGFLIEFSKIVTGADIMKYQTSLRVVQRPPVDKTLLLASVKDKMEALLQEKQGAVENLKAAAEEAMKKHGPHKEFIDFKDVKYYNAKKVVIEKDLENMDEAAKKEIKETITYLPTQPTWDFETLEHKPLMNSNTSTIHVPTNIYDKSTRILNGVQWSANLTSQFIANTREDSSLTWQYFCSSDGFFRIYPGMQWPRDADQVDLFDCRIRKWYIQAASSPKNILILLDSSGSMKGLRFSIARSTVTKIMETLSEEDYFNVIEFSEEPRYVDECFNDTMMPASIDNIKRLQKKIDNLEAAKFANFEKVLTKAFRLFQKEEMEFDGQYLCNKAIMIITDGAPENFDSVFDRFNWPEKLVRVFTFLIGKEVPDNRQTRWMACANKGKFAHISTRADVQENVQKYIKVLSRPLAIQRASHKVLSPVYIDYITDKSDIKVPGGRTDHLDVDFEKEADFEGLGLIMSISMPVFDERERVGPNEEEPERNLLGVVGTDVRINELLKLIPNFQPNLLHPQLWWPEVVGFRDNRNLFKRWNLRIEKKHMKQQESEKLGVHGYAFAITNHGYILFHPDYRPFFSDQGLYKQKLKVKPRYNSVELSEVELPTYLALGWNKEHPLRRYLLTSKSGGHNMTAVSVLTHSDGMKRARERRNHYEFMEVHENFRLVFVVPDGYGNHYIKVDPSSVPTKEQLVAQENLGTVTLSKWIYCKENGRYQQFNIFKLSNYMDDGTLFQRYTTRAKMAITVRSNENSSKFYICDKEHMQRLLKDYELTLEYARVWIGTQSRYGKKQRENEYVKEYDRCWKKPPVTETQLKEKTWCFLKNHLSYGIGKIWIGTSSGLTRDIEIGANVDRTWMWSGTQTIKSWYYKRAVDGWEDGFKYVFVGPEVAAQREFKFNTSFVTMSTAEIVGSSRPAQVPAAVAAFNMRYSAFYDQFVQYTSHCSDDSCYYTCNDTEYFSCYLLDHNGYVLATNNPDRNGTGLFLGQHNGRLMHSLVQDRIFKELKLADYQSMCTSKLTGDSESSSSFLMNPLRLITRLFFWFISEAVIFFSEWNMLSQMMPTSFFGYASPEKVSVNPEDDDECGSSIPDQFARYILCGFVIDESTGKIFQENHITSKRSCVQTVTRYTLNLEMLLARRQRFTTSDCFTQCASKSQAFYEAQWLNDTNLVFVVSDVGCTCNTSHSADIDSTTESSSSSPSISPTSSRSKFKFSVTPKEVLYDDDTQCQILLNFSEELKRVDNTRTTNTLCLDSSNEEDRPCNIPPPESEELLDDEY